MLSLRRSTATPGAPTSRIPARQVTSDTILSLGDGGDRADRADVHDLERPRFPWLPVAYPPQQIDVPDTTVRYNSSTGTATLDGELDAGAVYQATSVRVQPTPEQLAARDLPRAAQNHPSTSLEDVPPDVVTGIRAIADRWTAGAANDYERVLAIQDHLNDDTEFTYDTTVPHRDDSYTLLEFLTTTKRGFCQQFASAMAVMLRTLGFPARVAIGYTPGQRDPETGRVPRHHERAPQLGRGAVPDVRLARVRAHARPDEPRRERLSAPGRLVPSRNAGMPRHRGRRRHRRRPAPRGTPADFPGQLQNLARREFSGGLPLTPLPPSEAAGDPSRRLPPGAVVVLLLALGVVAALGDPALPRAAPPGSAAQSRTRAARADPRDVRRLRGARRRPRSSEDAGRDAPGVPVASRRRSGDHGRPPGPAHVDRGQSRLRAGRAGSVRRPRGVGSRDLGAPRPPGAHADGTADRRSVPAAPLGRPRSRSRWRCGPRPRAGPARTARDPR